MENLFEKHSKDLLLLSPRGHQGASCRVGCMASCPVAQARHSKISTALPQQLATLVATASCRSWATGGYFLGPGMGGWQNFEETKDEKKQGMMDESCWCLGSQQGIRESPAVFQRRCFRLSV